MVTLVKHEWHQCDVQYTFELDGDLLAEIYPDLDEDEIAERLQQIENGEIDIEDIINDAYSNDVDMDWEHQTDDMWTMNKGGYEVTYELGDESSWVEPEKKPEPTHKCTNCKWTGQSYDATWEWPEDDESGETEAKKVCPMCDSDTELTEAGKQEEKEKEERQALWDAEESVDEEETEDPVDEEELARALEELKQEFEQLMNHTHRCTECDWTGNETDHEKEGICPNCCAYTEKFDE
jgi:hypothetical protein